MKWVMCTFKNLNGEYCVEGDLGSGTACLLSTKVYKHP